MYALPKKIKRTEEKIDDPVAKWIFKNWPRDFGLEVKVGKNKLLDHQKKALKKVENGKFLYKLPDSGRRNPFDYVGLKVADAIVCTANGKNVHCRVNETYDIEFTL